MTRGEREHRIDTLVKEIKRYVLERNEFSWDFNQNAYDLLCNTIDAAYLNSFEKEAFKRLYSELLDSSNT